MNEIVFTIKGRFLYDGDDFEGWLKNLSIDQLISYGDIKKAIIIASNRQIEITEFNRQALETLPF